MERKGALMLFQILFLLVVVEDDALANFYTNTPETWTSEVIPFPLGFAPGIELKGKEILRFAPGMFKADQEDFYTYTFVWWLDEETHFTAASLEKQLLTYYQGLYKAVSKLDNKDINGFKSKIRKSTADGWIPAASQHFEGHVAWTDPFRTEKPVTMNLRIAVWKTESGKQAAMFLICPQDRSHSLWKTLESLKVRHMPKTN